MIVSLNGRPAGIEQKAKMWFGCKRLLLEVPIYLVENGGRKCLR
jgi:hypothetical protein